LEVERVKSKDGKTMQPFCMAQHYQMFRIYRRPGTNSDEQIILDRASSGDHIIIAHHNQVAFARVASTRDRWRSSPMNNRDIREPLSSVGYNRVDRTHRG